jgi:hypothetical protein
VRILVSGCTETVAEWHAKRPDRVGCLLTPEAGNDIPPDGQEWAADNSCFGGLNAPKWLRLLAKLAKCKRKPMWVTCPDVVGDAGETWRLYHLWAPVLRSLGLPVALVLQDGLERFKWRAHLPSEWDNLAAVFAGGSTAFKLSEHAEGFCREAKERGKLVHVGRVNTRERIEWIARWGTVDTIDGSGWSKWGEKRIPLGVRWIDRAIRKAAAQTSLF